MSVLGISCSLLTVVHEKIASSQNLAHLFIGKLEPGKRELLAEPGENAKSLKKSESIQKKSKTSRENRRRDRKSQRQAFNSRRRVKKSSRHRRAEKVAARKVSRRVRKVGDEPENIFNNKKNLIYLYK